MRVTARLLDFSHKEEGISENINIKGFILEVTDLVKKVRMVSLLFLSFDKKEHWKITVLHLRTIMRIVVKLEPMRRNNILIPLIKKCQYLSHTYGYC